MRNTCYTTRPRFTRSQQKDRPFSRRLRHLDIYVEFARPDIYSILVSALVAILYERDLDRCRFTYIIGTPVPLADGAVEACLVSPGHVRSTTRGQSVPNFLLLLLLVVCSWSVLNCWAFV